MACELRCLMALSGLYEPIEISIKSQQVDASAAY